MDGDRFYLGNGRVIDRAHFDSLAAELTAEQVAIALSNICRYGGHLPTGRWWSTGIHSLHLSEAIERAGGSVAEQLQALAHDAIETLLGEIPAPNRELLPDHEALEAMALPAVFRRFGLPEQLTDRVREFDLRIRANEGPWCMPEVPAVHWARYGEPLPGVEVPDPRFRVWVELPTGRGRVPMDSYPPLVAEAFLARFNQLLDRHRG